MLTLNQHLQTLPARFKRSLVYQIEVKQNRRSVSLHYVSHRYGVEREVLIHAENELETFDVEFIEREQVTAFVMRHWRKTYPIGTGALDDYAEVQDKICQFFDQSVDQAIIPEYELVKRWEALNSHFIGTPYAVHLFRTGLGEWAYRIHHREGDDDVIVVWSVPTNWPDIAYRSMLGVAQAAFDRGVIEGRLRAAEGFQKAIYDQAFDDAPTTLDNPLAFGSLRAHRNI